MKTHLFLFAVLCAAGRACESRDLVSVTTELRVRHIIAATQTNKTGGAKTAAPTTPSAPAPKPVDKTRERRPSRPAYLFL